MAKISLVFLLVAVLSAVAVTRAVPVPDDTILAIHTENGSPVGELVAEQTRKLADDLNQESQDAESSEEADEESADEASDRRRRDVTTVKPAATTKKAAATTVKSPSTTRRVHATHKPSATTSKPSSTTTKVDATTKRGKRAADVVATSTAKPTTKPVGAAIATTKRPHRPRTTVKSGTAKPASVKLTNSAAVPSTGKPSSATSRP